MSAQSQPSPYGATAVQKIALIVGIVFLVLGIAGFIPGLTTGVGRMQFAGSSSGAYLFGLFQVSVLHNAIHLLFGIAGVITAVHPLAARHYLLWGGVANVALWTWGLFTGGREGDVVPLNRAAVWAHLCYAVVMILLALVAARDPRTKSTGIKQLD